MNFLERENGWPCQKLVEFGCWWYDTLSPEEQRRVSCTKNDPYLDDMLEMVGLEEVERLYARWLIEREEQ